MRRRYKSAKIYAFALAFVIFMMTSFYTLYTYINESHASWSAHTKNEMEKAKYLDTAIIIFGYGGFIHNFKNAVLRRDIRYLEKAELQANNGLNALDSYSRLAPEHEQEVLNIKNTINEYKRHLQELKSLIKTNASVEAIDQRVKVNDEKAIQSLKNILYDFRIEPLEILTKSEEDYSMASIRLMLILGILLGIGGLMLFFIIFVNKKLAVKLKDLELIFHCAPNAIFTVNDEGIITSANVETMSLFGLSQKSLNTISVDDLVPSELKDKHQSLRQEFQQSDRIRPMSQRNAVFYGKKLNGEVFPASISIATHALDGQKNSIVIINDLSEEIRYKTDANTDSLTSIANRRAINEQFGLVLSRFKRQGNPLSICIFDIDHFKHVNDEFGHLVGDEILKQVANILKDNVRETDFLGRWGGEEFIVILEGTDRDGAVHFAEKVRNQIKTCSQEDNFPAPITISVGVVSCSDEHKANAENIFSCADKALYKSKANGRDCVTVF